MKGKCGITAGVLLGGLFLINGCSKVSEPQWIMSTSDKSWQTMTVSASQEKSNVCDIEILVSRRQQRIDGFGGCFNELGWEALQVVSDSVKTSILNDFFHPATGCRFNLCRMPVGANDYAVDWYSHNETPEDYDMAHFSIERDKQRLIPYIQKALSINPDIQIWASPWCPPSWMKTNGHYACRPAEVNDLPPEKAGEEMVTQFRMESDVLQAYALYLDRFISAYAKEGIDISAIHVQNEPNSCQNFPSCVWRPEDLGTLIGDYVGPHLEKTHPETEVWLGTIERPQPERVDVILGDEKITPYIDGVGFQWAGKGVIAHVNQTYPEKKLMQTETECGNGSNDWAASDYTFGLMKHYFENGANAYLYWNLILDETGKSQWGWKQNSMISVDRGSGSVQYNPEFYLMKHFSAFIEPGAVKVETTGPWQDVLAFQNPDGRVAVVMANRTGLPVSVKLQAGGQVYSMNLPAQSYHSLLL